jgi:hypothetical protein
MIEPAFPTGIITDDKGKIIGGSNGMTLRDYFAAKAMQSMNSRPDYDDVAADAIALDSYALADAMLKARDGNS